jgi:cell division cycle 14
MAVKHIFPSDCLGIVLTITDRLYLASYVETPDANTVFPYPDPPPRSPSKRSQRALESPAPIHSQKQPYYFTVDDTLLYNAFHHDFGPLHIGHLYRFALQFHEILGAKENKDRPIVFWSRADPRSMCPRSRLFPLLSGVLLTIDMQAAPMLPACSRATWSSSSPGLLIWRWRPSPRSTPH